MGKDQSSLFPWMHMTLGLYPSAIDLEYTLGGPCRLIALFKKQRRNRIRF